MSLTEFIFNISGEFKIMHFTLSNLLHDFNGKCMLFSLLNFLFINHVKNIRANPTRPATYFNPFKMTHFLLVTRLT